MLQKNIDNIEAKISSAGSEYERESAILSKINLLKKAGLEKEAEITITQYIRFEKVRRMRLVKWMSEKRYTDAIELIQEGIKVAIAEKHPGTVNSWKEDLLTVYRKQKNDNKVLSLAEELFYENPNHSKEYYEILKKYTSQKNWSATLERLLGKMNKGYFGFNSLKADILIEHKMWDRLFTLCQSSGVEKLEEYEKYLKPLYAKEIFDAYGRYVEKQATITDHHAYRNVARVLKKMKGYEGGKELVEQLVKKYREVYKRRKRMMGELEEV